jgi:hypothetical protein
MKFIHNVRAWSNEAIRRAIEPLHGVGSVVNVSGFDDRDKQGKLYRDYFSSSADYYLTYYPADQSKGFSGASCTAAYPLDLIAPLPGDLAGRFDLVFNHTVLEHVSNPFAAFENLAKMSRDLVLSVVPFCQKLHFMEGHFGDYFRFTPMGMRHLIALNGLVTLFEETTPSPAGEFYVVSLASKCPERHHDYPVRVPDIEVLNHKAGAMSAQHAASHLMDSMVRRIKRLSKNPE